MEGEGKFWTDSSQPGLAVEMDFHRIAPEGVAVLTTRMPLEKVASEQR